MVKLVLSVSRSFHTLTSLLQEEVNMTYWKVTDKILTGTVNFWKCTFLKLFILSGLNLEVLFTDLCVRWNLHSEIGLNEKKKKKIITW